MGTIDTIHRQSMGRIRRGPADRKSLMDWLQAVEHMMEKRRTRRALLELTDNELKDIGLSRSLAYKEASRPFWD